MSDTLPGPRYTQVDGDNLNRNRKVIARAFIHSSYIPNTKSGGDAVVVSEHVYYDNGDVEPNLRPIPNPQRKYYVTKKQLQHTHTEKKEREHINNCDMFQCRNKDFLRHAHQTLFGYAPKGYINKPVRDKILGSPYLYGGSVDIQSLVKIKYLKDFQKTEQSLRPITTGMFDTEISLIEGSEGELLCATLTHENLVFTAVNSRWMYTVDEFGNRHKASLDDLKLLSGRTLTPIINELFDGNKNLRKLREKIPFKFFYFESDEEIEMLRWLFQQLHRNETTFVGIWNMGYDIGEIVRMCEKHDVDPSDLFCPPDLDDEYRYFKYKADTKRTAHIADKWHWVEAPSKTQFVDLMAIYNKLRVVDGKESSYALDYILKKNGITGKLKFNLGNLETLEGTADWHRVMSTRHFLEYVVYNQWDDISLQCMEWMNADTLAVRILSDNTSISKFPRQTVKNQDTLWSEWIDRQYVFGTTASDMAEDYDDELEAEGGAVLDSFRVDKAGLKVIEEYPALVSQIHVYVSDVDFSQMYPTVMECANISKETKVTTAFSIFGPHVRIPPGPASVETFYSYMISIEDNAHNLGRDYFNFPTFEDLLTRYNQHRPQGG